MKTKNKTKQARPQLRHMQTESSFTTHQHAHQTQKREGQHLARNCSQALRRTVNRLKSMRLIHKISRNKPGLASRFPHTGRRTLAISDSAVCTQTSLLGPDAPSCAFSYSTPLPSTLKPAEAAPQSCGAAPAAHRPPSVREASRPAHSPRCGGAQSTARLPPS